MKKLENKNLEKQIIDLRSKNTPIRKIAKILNCSTSYIDRIIIENKKQVIDPKITISNGFIMKAKCKLTNELFSDIENKSGILTSHILRLYPGYKIPTGFKRRKEFKMTGKLWFEDFFEFVQVKEEEKKEVKQCKYCNWATYDLDNKSGAYTTHLSEEHQKSIENYIKEFPEEGVFFKTHLDKLIKTETKLATKDNYVICQICQEKLSYITNSHLKKHNINSDEYKLKFPNSEFSSLNFIEKTKKNLIEANKLAIKKYISKAEKNISEFLTKNGIKITCSNRKLLKGIEIDIVSEDHNIGIEYDGCKYHTEIFGKKTKDFHLNKTILMNNIGFKLIHIFEDEWERKNKIVISKLSELFNLNKNLLKIYAKNCTIKKIDSNIKNEFLNENHIQGCDNSVLYFGCFFKEELIAVMTFDNKRQMNKHNNPNVYELKRYCSKNGLKCIGTAGKLLKHFIKNYSPEKIISFADVRWTLSKETNLYTKIGFKLVKVLCPDYYYYNNKVDRLKRFHKFQFGKSSLRKKFPQIYDDSKSEWEIMQEAGYDRIWDCGKFKYELDLTTQPQNIFGH